jgi:hypothetical protein
VTVFAAIPWTYWLAPPLLAVVALMLAGFGLVYLKKVVEPPYRYLDSVSAGMQRSVGKPTPLARAPRDRPLAA